MEKDIFVEKTQDLSLTLVGTEIVGGKNGVFSGSIINHHPFVGATNGILDVSGQVGQAFGVS